MRKRTKEVSAADVIRRAMRHIEDAGWTQESYAKDTNGLCVDPCDVFATSFCLMGALLRARYDLGLVACPVPIYPIQLALNGGDLIQFNDDADRTPAQVLAVMRRSASLPEAQQPIHRPY